MEDFSVDPEKSPPITTAYPSLFASKNLARAYFWTDDLSLYSANGLDNTKYYKWSFDKNAPQYVAEMDTHGEGHKNAFFASQNGKLFLLGTWVSLLFLFIKCRNHPYARWDRFFTFKL